MPVILRLLPMVLPRLIKRMPRLNFYADHPEAAPRFVRYNHAREMSISIIKPFRIKFIVKGEYAPEKRAMYFLNHQSFFDAPATMMLMKEPTGYLAKKSVITYPLINQILRATDGDFIDRNDLRAEVRTIRNIADKLIADPRFSYAIWPEGRRTLDVVNYTMNEFKPGAFKAVYYAKCDIVPVAVFGTYRLLEFNRRDQRVYPIQYTFLPRITYDEYKDLSTVELAEKVYKIISAEVNRQREEQPQLEAYWNNKANAKRYRAELKGELKVYFAERKIQRVKERKIEKEWRKTHPLNKKKYRPVTYTKADRKSDKLLKKERKYMKKQFIQQAEEAQQNDETP